MKHLQLFEEHNHPKDLTQFKQEKVPVDGDEPEFGTEYEAMENITMRGLVGGFQLKSGDIITIEEGKMPKNYKVKLPTGGYTEVSQDNIQDLIALGRLQPVDEDIDESFINEQEYYDRNMKPLNGKG